MIPATASGDGPSEAETPLLNDVVQDSVDFKGRPAVRSKSGCWRSAFYLIGVVMAERFAYYGISSNLVSYLTGRMGQTTATAAANVNVWHGTASLSPLLGAYIADSFLGGYRMIIIANLFYILGLGLLSVSAVLQSFNSASCEGGTSAMNKLCSIPPLYTAVFFFCSLYLVALAQGGHKPCLLAFGAEQFSENDKEECKSKSSFFNWWSFGVCSSMLVSYLVMSYIQDNLSWELGFGIPCILLCFAVIFFLLGSTTYRFRTRNSQVASAVMLAEEEAGTILPHESTRYRLPDEPLLEPKGDHVKDAKAILKLLPLCFSCLAYTLVFSQGSTLFVKQGATMDRYITATFQIPPAAIQSFSSASAIISIALYDRVLVPFSRSFTQKPSGISMLQRIGIGILLCIISISIAALIERKRLVTAFEHGLVNSPKATVPMSVWWLAPQYVVLGVSEMFTYVGLQEFLYNQVPKRLKSMGLALFLAVCGCGSLLSSFLISVIDKASGGQGRASWFSNNLNRAHLDYFYWLLAGLNVISLGLFIYFAKSYADNS